MDRKIWDSEDVREYLERIIIEFQKLEDRNVFLEEENRNLRMENTKLYEESKKWESKAKEGGFFSRLFPGKKDKSDLGNTNPLDASLVRQQLEEEWEEEEDAKEALLEGLKARKIEEVPGLFIQYFQEEPTKEEVLNLLQKNIPRNDPAMLNVILGFLGEDLLHQFLTNNEDLFPLIRNKAVEFPNQWKVCKHLYLMEDPTGSIERQIQSILQILTESRDFQVLPSKEGELFAELFLAIFHIEDEEYLTPFVRILKREELEFLKKYLSVFQDSKWAEVVLEDLKNRSWYLRDNSLSSGVKLKVYKAFMENIENLWE
ncbi:MAG: hypothetical protein Q4Q07_03145 [Tissierellia bacterium]|nr:hypothetical protein [Tissierellia bacterium]